MQTNECDLQAIMHDDVIKWKHFSRYWPFVRGIHWSPVNSPHKGQWHGALFFDLHLNKRLSKQSWGGWFERLSHPLWRHCNGMDPIICTHHRPPSGNGNKTPAFLLYEATGRPTLPHQLSPWWRTRVYLLSYPHIRRIGGWCRSCPLSGARRIIK